jgi:hypothetical protein
MSFRIPFTRLRRKFLRCWEIGLSAVLLLAAAGISAYPGTLGAGLAAAEPVPAAAQCGNAQSNTAVITR